MAVKKRTTGGYVKLNEYGRRINDSGTKLTDHEVQLVLELLADGLSQREIAAKMQISRFRVSTIAQRKARGKIIGREIDMIREVYRSAVGAG